MFSCERRGAGGEEVYIDAYSLGSKAVKELRQSYPTNMQEPLILVLPYSSHFLFSSSFVLLTSYCSFLNHASLLGGVVSAALVI